MFILFLRLRLRYLQALHSIREQIALERALHEYAMRRASAGDRQPRRDY